MRVLTEGPGQWTHRTASWTHRIALWTHKTVPRTHRTVPQTLWNTARGAKGAKDATGTRICYVAGSKKQGKKFLQPLESWEPPGLSPERSAASQSLRETSWARPGVLQGRSRSAGREKSFSNRYGDQDRPDSGSWSATGAGSGSGGRFGSVTGAGAGALQGQGRGRFRGQ